MSFSRYIDGSRVVYWDDTTGNLTVPGAITASTFLGASFSLGPSVQFSSIQCSSINAGAILNGANTATLTYTNTSAPASDGKVNAINITNLNQRVRPSYGEQLLFTSSMSWTNWAVRTPAANYSWRKVAWSPTLKLYCAVASDDIRNNNIMTSPDGINWTLRIYGVLAAIGSIIWADTLGRFVAIGDNGVTVYSFYSSDGINWFTSIVGTNAFWIELAWSPQLGRMVAVGWRAGVSTIAYSSDGVSWTVITPGVTSRWYGICWSAELGLFVALSPFADAGTNRCIMTSPDGLNWTQRTVPATKDWFSIAWSGELGLFAAVSRSGDTLGVMTSPDGVNWTLRSTPAHQFGYILWSPELSMFIVSNLNNASITISRDGVTWTAYPVLSSSRTYYGMVWSREQSKLVIVDENKSAPGSHVITSEVALPASQNTLLFASPGYASVNNSNGLISMSSMNISTATARALTVYSITPSDSNVRFGSNTALSNPGSNTVAIGHSAGFSNQGNDSIAIGHNAGVWSQGSNAVAIGYSAGNSNQAAWGVAIGLNAGASNQSNFGIGIGFNAGYANQGLAATAFGPNCGFSNQGNFAFAGGDICGYFAQGAGAVAIGRAAGYSNQGIHSIAIGSNAGSNNQSSYCVAIGLSAGETNQNAFATAIGINAGYSNQGIAATALGANAGAYNQSFRAVALGDVTAYSNQGSNAVAIGASAGESNQGNFAVSLGYNAGRTSQGSNAIAIGNSAGETSQVANSIILNASNVALNAATNAGFYVNPVRNVETGNIAFYDTATKEVSYGIPRFSNVSSVNISSAVVTTSTINTNTISSAIASFSTINAVDISSLTMNVNSLQFSTMKIGYSDARFGLNAGSINPGSGVVAIGPYAADNNQGFAGVAIGLYAGNSNQATYGVAVGYFAGYELQKSYAIAIGNESGLSNQGEFAIAIGTETARYTQGDAAVAIGKLAGFSNQRSNAISIGQFAGYNTQATNAIAIGYDAGRSNQSPDTVALGVASGYYNQASNAIAVGGLAGYSNQASNAVAVGNYAGFEAQGIQAVAIGSNAGRTSQGSNAIAIGNGAGETNQVANSIILNASNVALNAATNAGFYVNPVRSATAANVVYYDTGTKEMTYSSPPAVVSSFNSLSTGTASIGALNVSSIGGFSPINIRDAVILNSSLTASSITAPVISVSSLNVNSLNVSTIQFVGQYQKTFNVSLSSNINSYVELCSLQQLQYTSPIEIRVCMYNGDEQTTLGLMYMIGSGYNQTVGNWYECLPLVRCKSDSTNITNEDVTIDIKNEGSAVTTFRLRRRGTTPFATAFTYFVSLTYYEIPSLPVTFTDLTSNTGSNSATQFYNGTALTQYQGRVGINFVNPTTYDLTLANNSAAKPTSDLWTISSDRRIKDDIQPANLDVCYSTIKALKLSYFKYKDEYVNETQEKDRHVLGFIAQDVSLVLSKSVTITPHQEFTFTSTIRDINHSTQKSTIWTSTLDNFYSLNADQIYKLQFGATQKLIELIETQASKISTLEAKVALLSA